MGTEPSRFPPLSFGSGAGGLFWLVGSTRRPERLGNLVARALLAWKHSNGLEAGVDLEHNPRADVDVSVPSAAHLTRFKEWCNSIRLLMGASEEARVCLHRDG
jgi:hypothetical protein